MTDERDGTIGRLIVGRQRFQFFVQVQPFRFELFQFAANLTLAQQCFLEPILVGVIVTMRFGKRVFNGGFLAV